MTLYYNGDLEADLKWTEDGDDDIHILDEIGKKEGYGCVLETARGRSNPSQLSPESTRRVKELCDKYGWINVLEINQIFWARHLHSAGVPTMGALGWDNRFVLTDQHGAMGVVPVILPDDEVNCFEAERGKLCARESVPANQRVTDFDINIHPPVAVRVVSDVDKQPPVVDATYSPYGKVLTVNVQLPLNTPSLPKYTGQ